MQGGALNLVVGDAMPLDEAVQRAEAVLHCWHGAGRPRLNALTASQLEQSSGPLPPGVAWLVFEHENCDALFRTVATVGDANLPAIVSFLQECDPVGTPYDEGLVVCPFQEDVGTTCAMLQALWSQSQVIASLRAEMRLLQAEQGGLAGQIGKMDEELRLAAQLQRDFLPTTLPQIGDVQCEVLWRPASYVSGDIYDVQRLDETHVGLFVADAVGHGVPAALMTMFIKRSLRPKQIDPSMPDGYRIVPPAEALASLNHDMVQRQSDHVRFATACYGVLDCETFELTLARAGHPFPIVLKADGSTESVQCDGGLLGVFEDEQYEQMQIQLERGDRLLLYSDGFEVAFGDGTQGQPIASDQYTEEFEALRYGRMDEALTRLRLKLDHQAGSLNQRDDLTVLCVGIEPNGAAGTIEGVGETCATAAA